MESSAPYILGPDEGPSQSNPGWTKQYLGNVTNLSKTLRYFTTHMYGVGPNECTTDLISNDTFLGNYRQMISQSVALGNAFNISTVCGECGNCFGGGVWNVTNTFASSFWYLDSLGFAAQSGMKKFIRSDLIGGDYAVIDYDSMQPNPDYYALLLWTRNMGRLAFSTSDDHVYAHCSKKGGMALLCLNNDQKNRTFQISNQTTDLSEASITVITADSLSSRSVCLMKKDNTCVDLIFNGKMVPLIPASPLTSNTFTLPPISYAFIHLPRTNTNQCK